MSKFLLLLLCLLPPRPQISNQISLLLGFFFVFENTKILLRGLYSSLF